MIAHKMQSPTHRRKMKIDSHGESHAYVNMGLRKLIDWIFVGTDTTMPIISVDLLQAVKYWLTRVREGP